MTVIGAPASAARVLVTHARVILLALVAPLIAAGRDPGLRR
jgi:hypothetical protein